ncbi:hypothetical protein Tco_1057426 [Tanacetum coccineum]|uniref:Uncharacterized protein n=1 Tax=Tanacetum coccineum TaxID=301880 RepID=A0ABQ5H6N8_9ASTR
MEECHKLLTDKVDDAIIRYNVSKPLPLGGQPGQVTIQADFFFNKDLEYLRYGSKGGRPALSISKMKAACYPDVGLEQMVPDQMWIEEECKYDIAAMYGHIWVVQMIMRFNEIHKFSDGTLQQIDEALDYKVKEFKVNRMNSGLNTRFWTRKDVDRSKEFMFAIQKRLKTKRIFRNLECFVGGRVREETKDYMREPNDYIISAIKPLPAPEAMVMDIQEKDKNRSQIDNRARERKERERKVKSKPKVKVKSSQSQPREVDLERASKTEPENLNCQKWAHPYPPTWGTLNLDGYDDICDLSHIRSTPAKALSKEAHLLEPSFD